METGLRLGGNQLLLALLEDAVFPIELEHLPVSCCPQLYLPWFMPRSREPSDNPEWLNWTGSRTWCLLPLHFLVWNLQLANNPCVVLVKRQHWLVLQSHHWAVAWLLLWCDFYDLCELGQSTFCSGTTVSWSVAWPGSLSGGPLGNHRSMPEQAWPQTFPTHGSF